MIDLEKLKNIDLQNIDFSKIDINKIIEAVLEKKDVFASWVIAAVAVMIAIVLTRNFFVQTASVNADIAMLKGKIEVISKHDRSRSLVKKFLKSLPPSLDEEQLSTTITDLASANNVSITSFVPGQHQKDELYEAATVAIAFETPDYPALLKFLKALENAPNALRIDACSVVNRVGDRMGNDLSKNPDDSSGRITVHMDISSMQVKP